MDMETAARARLVDGQTGGIVGSRIYWDERPQGGALPDVTLQLISDNRAQHFGGFQTLLDARIQVDVRAASFAGKKALKEAVIADLAGAHTGNGIRFTRAADIQARTANERTETKFIFRDAIDFVIHYQPSA